MVTLRANVYEHPTAGIFTGGWWPSRRLCNLAAQAEIAKEPLTKRIGVLRREADL